MEPVIVEKFDAWKGTQCPNCQRLVDVSYSARPELRELSLHGPGKSGMFCSGSGRPVKVK